MTVSDVFLDSKLVKIWWRCESLNGLRCRICGHKLKVEKKHIAEALKDYLDEIEYWTKRFERLEKLRDDFKRGRFKSIKEFISALKKALDFPRNPHTAIEAGNAFFVIRCPKCDQPYNFRVDFRIHSEAFKSTEAFFSWFDLLRLPIGDEKVEWHFRRKFGRPWPQYQEEMYKKFDEQDYGPLLDAAVFFRQEFRLAVDLAKPLVRFGPKKAEEITKFWREFHEQGGWKRVTYTPPRS